MCTGSGLSFSLCLLTSCACASPDLIPVLQNQNQRGGRKFLSPAQKISSIQAREQLVRRPPALSTGGTDGLSGNSAGSQCIKYIRGTQTCFRGTCFSVRPVNNAESFVAPVEGMAVAQFLSPGGELALLGPSPEAATDRHKVYLYNNAHNYYFFLRGIFSPPRSATPG